MKKTKKIWVSVLLSVITLAGTAQSSANDKPLHFNGYMELYYANNFSNPPDHTGPSFMYSHNRVGEPALNLGLIKAAYTKPAMRANLSLAAGTYTDANLASEPTVFKNIYEANAGLKLSRYSQLWIDAGIMPSHIGFESAVGKDCWNLTRSIPADNSPYYETGVKLSYSSGNNQWYFAVLLLNGWQRIHRAEGNKTLSFGSQITYKPSSSATLNISSFIGNDKPDSIRQMRYFHNLYGIFELNKQIALTAGFDFGWEQKAKGSNKMNNWYSPVLILKINTSSKTKVALRCEYYSDLNGVIIATDGTSGFSIWGFSGNFDFAITSNVLWRIEARTFTPETKIIYANTLISTSLAINF